MIWMDPSNDLSKVRSEDYVKRRWEWEGNQLIMPGVIWLVKEPEGWRIDLVSGTVPKTAFRKYLRSIFPEAVN